MVLCEVVGFFFFSSRRRHTRCSRDWSSDVCSSDLLQRGALGEGHLHDALVRLAGADDAGVLPHRNPSPLPLLDHFGVGLLDESSDPSERLAPPIAQLLDSRIYQLSGRVSTFSFLRTALGPLDGCCRSFGNDG